MGRPVARVPVSLSSTPRLSDTERRGGSLPYRALVLGFHFLSLPPPRSPLPKPVRSIVSPSLDSPTDGGLGVGGHGLYHIPWNVHYSCFERPSSFSSNSLSPFPLPLLLSWERKEEEKCQINISQSWRRDWSPSNSMVFKLKCV